jgi:hypothetical protein
VSLSDFVVISSCIASVVIQDEGYVARYRASREYYNKTLLDYGEDFVVDPAQATLHDHHGASEMINFSTCPI